ncbi:hypothetical protein INS49_014041 [Diaporthe citri]|uniref:uncharacterized protein n=1 Tax=Diaporthe citri TaxID=83186 RepID=UPI001C80EACF|nr:uncharacterized protein INS49_014041 [Diaporthe citri]KAG6358157.1 hypothetical protein INS49_014041 [Diaporthe citri]
MAEILRTLRFRLAGPLEDYFDLVVATGIGIFFATLIFCKGATVADCVHHLGDLQYIRAKKQEIRFGNSLRFRGDEMGTKGPKLFFQHGSFTLSPHGPQSGQALDVDAEIEKLWPGSTARIVVDLQPPFGIQPVEVPDHVLVSLFYVELPEKPVFYSTSPLIVTVVIKCRLQPSPHLATLLLRMRTESVQVYFKGDEPTRKADFCDDHAWNGIKQGNPFLRQCHLLVRSLTSVIDIRMDSILGKGRVPLSHSPWTLLDLAQFGGQNHKEAEAVAVLDKINHMEDRLYGLRMG